MDEVSIEIEIPSDDEGYVSLQCPACIERFKLSAGELNDRDPDELYCPLCGLSADASEFHTPEVLETAEEHVQNLVADLLNDFTRDLGSRFRGNKLVRFDAGKKIPHKQVTELRETPDLWIAEFSCCESTAKVAASAAAAVVYCAFCGQVRAV